MFKGVILRLYQRATFIFYHQNRNEVSVTMNQFERERLRIQRTKQLYPPGTRIVLGEMSDPYSPVPPGTCGTVQAVDDMGTVHPVWDNGRTLGVIPGEDSFRKLTQEELAEESQISEEAEEVQEEGGMGFGM